MSPGARSSASTGSGSGTGARRRRQPWERWPDSRLLELRFSDLDLRLEGSRLGERIDRVLGEFARCNIPFRPHFWLAEDFFTPDGVPGIAVPFYLAHPRLARLEENQMMEVEGGSPEWCLRILRHELGHAVDNAFLLRRRRKRQQIFGRSSQPYPDYYAPKPYSKRFVLHLDSWYAQSHPDEDFAETFAVWLQPTSAWRRRYAGWPALKKLEYMDELMRSLVGKKPRVTTRRKVDPIQRLRGTLGEYYAEKRRRYGFDYPAFYDRDLRQLFSDLPEFRANRPADAFLRSVRAEVCRKVARWTGTYQYTIDQVLEDMITRCQELGLHLSGTEQQTTLDFTVLLTVQTMNYLHSGRHRIAL
ncbi:MAG: putative zinc-binding metallopeptidase [Planctomycetes bacterium]|nr:putative zinc-binding metallopeptidase [Planctomycetota bacterium]